jgi:hypothetical protein
MNIKQLADISKFWLWSAMHSEYFSEFEITIDGIIQLTSKFYPVKCCGDFAELHVYFTLPRIQVYIDWRAESAFIEEFPQYKNADWLSCHDPF